MTRDYLTRRIGQAHLAPGMNSEILTTLLLDQNVTDDWQDVPDQTIDTIVETISTVGNQAKGLNDVPTSSTRRLPTGHV